MLVDFIGDRTTHSLDQQYMFGSSLLFAPVFGDEGYETEYYLPAGIWTAYTPLLGSGKPRVIEGPKWIKETIPYDQIPAFVKAGSVLPLGPPNMKMPDYDLAKNIEIRLYQIPVGATSRCDIPTGQGVEIAATLEVTRSVSQLCVTVVDGRLNEWSIRLFQDGLDNVGQTSGAQLQGLGECTEYGGFLFKVESGAQEIAIDV